MSFSRDQLTSLGRGANSEIFRYGCLDRAVVLKTVSSSCLKQCKHLANEFRMLNEIEHANVIRALKYRESIAFQGTDKVDQQDGSETLKNGGGPKKQVKNVLVLEHAKYGSLLNFCSKKKLSAKEARWVMEEIFEAMDYLHQKKIAHRDLKLQNILVSSDKGKVGIKLADFGFAQKVNKDSFSKAYKGTMRGYMAPEINNILKNHNEPYDIFKADVFALGVILFALVLGRLPFQHATPQNCHYKLIIEGKIDGFWQLHKKAINSLQNQQSNLSEQFKELFIKMVHPDPKMRPTIKQIFQTPWLLGRQQIIKQPCLN